MRWRRLIVASGPSDRVAARKAIQRLYGLMGREDSTIIFCESPFQLIMLPSLVMNVLNSDPWFILSGQLRERVRNGEEIERVWETVWQEVWDDLANPILHHMVRTLFAADEYLHLFPPLRDALEEQLLERLKAGKYELVEATLNENAYRQAWLVQEWFSNSAETSLEGLLNDLFSSLSTRAKYLKKYVLDADELDGLLARTIDYSMEVEIGLRFIIGRMGAEAVSQTRSARLTSVIADWFVPHLVGKSLGAHSLEDADADKEVFDTWLDVVESMQAFLILENICFVCEKPLAFSTDEEGKLHSAAVAALEYSDGFQIHAWHGVIVPYDIIEYPESITAERIDREINAEVRRVMMERFGQARYLTESGAVEVHSDDFGTLYRKDIPNDEPLVMVKVVNSTPEPDGSYKDYFLRVPPHIERARAAVAWTFGFEEDDYTPDKET